MQSVCPQTWRTSSMRFLAWTRLFRLFDSMHAYQREKMKEEKRKSLEARREKLRQLMREEQDLLARELEELRLSMNLHERRIREQHGKLKSAREEQRKLIAEQLLYEHWKKNNPKLREVELDLHQKHVVNSWETQKEEKKQQEATAEQENKRYENEYERARREALERMKAEEERRQLEDKLQAEALLQQMEELKLKEVEATKLKKEQENLLKQRWELERLEEERKQMEAFRQKAELGCVSEAPTLPRRVGVGGKGRCWSKGTSLS
uniref:Trichoplein keratin filament-binding protein n=1 Tax=Macaca fascicularis TaxID=9541 RepID=A0A2K5VBA3_MACFA